MSSTIAKAATSGGKVTAASAPTRKVTVIGQSDHGRTWSPGWNNGAARMTATATTTSTATAQRTRRCARQPVSTTSPPEVASAVSARIASQNRLAESREK